MPRGKLCGELRRQLAGRGQTKVALNPSKFARRERVKNGTAFDHTTVQVREQAAKLFFPMKILPVKSFHPRAPRTQAMQQVEGAGTGRIAAVILRVPCFYAQRKDVESLDPGEHGVLGMGDDSEAVMFLNVADDALGILRLCKHGSPVAQNVHFLFASVLETAEEEELIVGQGCAFADVVRKLRRIKLIVVVGDADDRAAFIEEELFEGRKSKFAVGIRTVDVKCGFQHAKVSSRGAAPNLSGKVNPVAQFRQRISPLEIIMERTRFRRYFGQ